MLLWPKLPDLASRMRALPVARLQIRIGLGGGAHRRGDLPDQGQPKRPEIHVALDVGGVVPPHRLREIAKLGGGYTYCVARAGVTGADQEAAFDHAEMLATLREAGAPPPVFGFGISRPDHVRAALATGAAGVISGSAIVGRVARGEDVTGFVREMKAATL